MYALSGNNVTPATGNETALIDEYITVKHLDLIAQCTVADTTGVIGARINGALLFVGVGDNGAGTTDCEMKLQYRIGFTD